MKDQNGSGTATKWRKVGCLVNRICIREGGRLFGHKRKIIYSGVLLTLCHQSLLVVEFPSTASAVVAYKGNFMSPPLCQSFAAA